MPGAGDLVAWSGDASDLAGWSANAAGGSHAALACERAASGSVLRIDFDLAGHGAWAIARRQLAAAMPPHYVVSLRLRGVGHGDELQVKLVDASGANVWWWRRHGFVPPAAAARLVLHRAGLQRAWGPARAADPDRIGAIEIAVAADRDARGSLWIEDLRIEPREIAPGPPRPCALRASSAAAGHEPARAQDGDASTSWRPDPDDRAPWLELDLGGVREWGGIAVDFDAGTPPAARVGISDDGVRFTPLPAEAVGAGRRRWLKTGEVESRFVRLELDGGTTAGVTRVSALPIELAASPARFAATIAKAAPRGRFPRHLLDEQQYWAVVGADGDARKGLLGEDGALEIDAEQCTIEPFLRLDDRLLTWADGERTVALADGALPVPTVERHAAGLRLRVTAFAAGEAGASTLVARYELATATPVSDALAVTPPDVGGARDVRLLLAIRPFQVTPAWQSLNLVGGIAPLTSLERAGARLRVNDAFEIIAVTAPDAVGLTSSDGGLERIFDDEPPRAERADDPLGFAQGVLVYDLRVAPGASATVVVAVPLFAATPPPPAGLANSPAAAWADAGLAATLAHWRARLARVPISLPPAAAAVEASLRASLAWILVNRDGPRIQPGPRAYRRSWIRDGSITGTALAEMGFADEARAFLRWYAPYQLADGRVPCAVDRRGVDHAVEHDSHGELVWGIVEVFRLTGDQAFLRALWPRVLGAVDALAALRAERSTAAYRERCAFGLLPESISHEGYAASPVHSYWDDLFAVRAFADAADAARVLGDDATAVRAAALRDAMRRDLQASIACAMARRRIDFLPGCVELGDFDPTSTAIAFDPCGEAERLPRAALERTFERYWRELDERWRGERGADAFTPYEVRNVIALLRLGWKTRALALLDWIVAEQRPTAWRQWPEVAHRDRLAPCFLGDLPHGWVASSFVRAVRRLLVDEREDDASLVIAAGVPEAWVCEAPGVRVRALPTRFGPLDLTLCAEGDEVRVRFGAARPRPPGGVVIVSPRTRPLRDVVVDGRARGIDDPGRVRLTAVPADVLLRYADATETRA